MLVLWLCVLGVAVSLYGLKVHLEVTELKAKGKGKGKGKGQGPACDLSDRVSCSKAIGSEYGSLFWGLPNPVAGMAYYLGLALLSLLNFSTLAFAMSLIGLVFSCFLAYILATKIKSLCLICLAIYAINGALVFATA